MDPKDARFWIRLLGALLAVASLAIIFLGSYLFDQSAQLVHAGKDLSRFKAERETLAVLLAELTPIVPESEALAVAERSGLGHRYIGEGEDRKLVIEGIAFELRDGSVLLDLDP